MRLLFPFLFILLITSCRKNSDSDGPGSSLAMDTVFLSAPIPGGLQSLFFIDENEGFVGNYAGGIYKTTDAGNTWTAQNSLVTYPIRSLFFLDAQTGFAAGGENSCGGSGCTPYGGFILKTTNGGQTWTRVFTPTTKNELSSIYFVNSSLGFCVGDNLILKTTNGGQTWSEYRINNLGGKMMQVRFKDAQTGWVVCMFDKIIKTEDGGATWQVTSPQYNNGYYSISETNGSIYVSGQGRIIKSTNEGTSWAELPGSPYDIFAIHFINNKKGFAFGRGNYSGGDWGYSYGSIYYTENGGITWEGTANVKETGMLVAVSFPTNNIAYAISPFKIMRIRVN